LLPIKRALLFLFEDFKKPKITCNDDDIITLRPISNKINCKMRKFSNALRLVLAALTISLAVTACSKNNGDDDEDEDNLAAPVITSISPSNAKIGGTITINGTDLFNPTVSVATKLATVSSSTTTSITAIVPSGIALGDASVRVTTDKGTVVSAIVIVP
jgi:hypothetical protein